MYDKANIEKLMIDTGHAINANDGRCALIEDVLCRVTTLCVELLAQFDEEEYSHAMHQENPAPHYFPDSGLKDNTYGASSDTDFDAD